jgi:XRE family transcriptional regulator, regulator of sulfur utilization
MTISPSIEATAFGQEVRRLRQARGLSLDQLAALANISRLTLLHLEQGKSSTRLTTLEQVASALDCSLMLEPYPLPEDLGCAEVV